jgi:hypothetical protein
MSMQKVRKSFFVLALVLSVLALVSVAAAQVRTVGRVVVAVEDPAGATVLGAKLTLVDTSTGQTREGSSGADGQYVFIDVPSGIYKLSVVLQGFRTGVYPDIKVDIGGTTNVAAKLELGAVSDTVVVEGAAEIIQTTQTSVESTISHNLLASVPLNNRNALDFVMLTAGAQQGGSARQGTFFGLPKGAINITMDGINIQDNLLKSSFGGGLFTLIQPKIDIVEELNVSSAAGGAEGAGEGAVQIKFITRRGTNNWHGSLFEYYRGESLNANTWFNNAAFPRRPNPKNILNQYGGNVGGPIWKDKAFFFFALEDFRLPSAQTRTNSILKGPVAGGLFPYRPTSQQSAGQDPNRSWIKCDSGTAPNQVCTANLLSPALLGSLPSSIDGTIGSMLSTINGTRANGSISSSADLLRDTLRWDAPSSQHRYFPTLRLDYNVTKTVSWNIVGNWNNFASLPDTLNSMDPSFPGLKSAGGQFSKRWSIATAVTWLIRPNLTSEFRIGRQRSHVKFFPESLPGDLYPNGLRLLWPLGLTSLNARPGTSATSRSLPSDRDTPSTNAGVNIGWLKGKHAFNFGSSVSIYTHWDNSLQNFGIPIVNFGVVAGDPAENVIGPKNLPGIGTPDVGDARALYALLTGRLSSISGSRNVDEITKTYLPGKPLTQRNRQNEFGFYASDSWRIRNGLTMNYGLRWEYQGAPYNTNGIYTSATFADLWGKSGGGNLFKPGTLTGNSQPQISLRTNDLYNRDYKNFAPSLGFAWTPNLNNSVWNAVFGGSGKSVIRAGYSIAYTREGLSHHTTFAGGSPGQTQSITLRPGDTGFTAGNLLLRNPLPPLNTKPATFSFPAPQSQLTFSGNDIYSIDPNLKTPYVQSWTFGIQRELTPNTVLEVRYVGNHGTRLWRGYNINEVNIVENGFLKEFIRAQTNLGICRTNASACMAAQTAAGIPAQDRSANNFNNWGLAGQQPLTVLPTAFSGLRQPIGFASGTFVTQLDQGQAGGMANSIAGSPTYLCRMVGNGLQACADRSFNAAGVFPANFFQVNPDAAGANAFLLANNANSTYNGLQIELRKRLSRGLQVTGNYTWSKSLTDRFDDSGSSTDSFTTLRNPGYDKGPSPWDLRHSARMYWLYELPFGPGRKWSTGSHFVNKAIEGWQLTGVVAIQSGRIFQLTSGRNTFNQNDSGIVLNGLTADQLQNFAHIVKPAGTPGKSTGFVYFIDPSLIGANGRANPNFLQVASTPGQLGQHVFLRGPRFVKPDLSVGKTTTITEKINLVFHAEFFNAFNYQNFMVGAPGSAGVTTSIDSTTFGQTNVIFNDLGNQDPGPRMIQFSLRLNF